MVRGFGGRLRLDDRTFLNAILWLLCTGCPWRDLPPCYGNWSSISTRFYRWVRNGVWTQLLRRLQEIADQRGEVGWVTQYIDSPLFGLTATLPELEMDTIMKRWALKRWVQYQDSPQV